MYNKRKFKSWKEGIIHLIVVILMPLLPIAIYMIDKKSTSSYLYVLLLTVIISFAYEFVHMTSKCSTFLLVENIITCIALAIMFIWDVFLLTYVSGSNAQRTINKSDYVLVSLFVVPVLTTLIELVRVIIFDIKSNKCVPNNDKNLIDGASNI